MSSDFKAHVMGGPKLTLPNPLPTLAECIRLFYSAGTARTLTFLIALAAAARAALWECSTVDACLLVVIPLVWPLQEWLIHVNILHFQPRNVLGRAFDLKVAKTHRAHHADPWRFGVVFIPAHIVALTVPALTLLCMALLPAAQPLTGVTVYLALAWHYEWVHFLVHTRYVPKSARYRRLWRNHRLHHFKNEKLWFGVTMLGGDALMRTQPPPEQVENSPTARSLLGVAGNP